MIQAKLAIRMRLYRRNEYEKRVKENKKEINRRKK